MQSFQWFKEEKSTHGLKIEMYWKQKGTILSRYWTSLKWDVNNTHQVDWAPSSTTNLFFYIFIQNLTVFAYFPQKIKKSYSMISKERKIKALPYRRTQDQSNVYKFIHSQPLAIHKKMYNHVLITHNLITVLKKHTNLLFE